jgi:hypothetical protein
MLAILAASLNWEPAPVKSAAPVQIFLPYIHHTVPVVISELKCFHQKYVGLIARGNVLNFGDATVYNVKIQADFTDYTGKVISSTERTVFTPTVSMQRNPFEIGTFDNTVYDCKAKIVSFTWESTAEYLPLTIVSADTNSSPVSVLFRNDNPVPLKNVIVYAWSLEQYFSFGSSPLKDPIAPGETITYTNYITYGSPPIYVLGMGAVDP